MTIKICGHDECDDICRILDEVTHDVEEMTEKAFEGLLKHNRKSLDEAERIGAKAELQAKQVTQLVLSTRDESTEIRSDIIIEVAGGMQKIIYCVDKIIGSIRTKADEGVLFSDKAMFELKDFFAAIIDGLRHVHDLVLTNNHVLVTHIVQKAEVYEEIARKYAEEHQDRLIKGICLPKSSLVYLLILESLKDVLWSIKAVALAFKNNE